MTDEIGSLEDDYNSVRGELSTDTTTQDSLYVNDITKGFEDLKVNSPNAEPLLQDYEDVKSQQLSMSAYSAFEKNPEESARAYNLAKTKNLPVDYVERNLSKVSAPDVNALPPAVSELMRDRQKAGMIHDDLDNLSWWETAAQEAGNIGKTALSGMYSTSAAGYSVLGSTVNLFSDLSLAPARLLGTTEEELKQSGADIYGPTGRYLMDLASGQRAMAEAAFPKKTAINSAVLGGIKSVVMNAPAMAAGVISRNPQVAMGAIGASTYGDSYLTAKQSGLSETASVSYATNQALAEVVTESIPVGRLFKDLGADAGMFKTIAMQMVTEIPTEQVATIWQDAIDWAVLNPEKTLSEFAAERKDAAIDTLVSTVVATGLQSGAIAGLDRLGRRKEEDQIQAIADNANASKVNTRTPEIFAEHVQSVAEEHGSPTEVYIDAKEARALFQDMKKDAAYDLIAAQIVQAEAVGGDIVIPMGEFASKVATSENFAALKQSIRLSPDSPSGIQETNQPERIASLIDEANKNIEQKSRSDSIYKEITKQLINSGRMNADTAKVNASLVPAFVTTAASNLGVSVDEAYSMLGVTIDGPNGADSGQAALSQSTIDMAQKDPVLKGYLALSSKDEAFKLPKSESKNIEGVFSDLEGHKGVKLTRFPVMDQGDTKVWKVNPDSKTMGMIFEDSKNVWVDVSNLKQGQGGQRIYNAVANYAYNSGKTFIGDPASLSDVGVSRRLENMLNAALKFGTTKHLAPHPRQLKGTDDVAALDWKVGNDQHNITEMLKASFKATKKQFPEIENIAYDGNTDKFIDKATSNEFTRDDFTALAASKRTSEAGAKSKVTAGRTTLERAVLTNSLLSTKGAEQSAILDRLSNELPERLGGVLYQSQSGGEKRGGFYPGTNIIKLRQASDLSTFAHELGHAFLEMYGRMFNHPNATDAIKADGQTILDWLGIESFERLKEFETDNEVREAHEKFARGFEKYLAEGKAPSIELKAVFRRFAAWMKQVYRDLRNLNVELNDNVREVMDRMLATDEQINRAKNVFDPLFKDAKDAGMTEPEFKAYSMESSPDSAKEVLLAKMLKQLKREYTKWWKDESVVIADQVRKEVAKQPLYSALDSMRADDSKLNRADVEANFSGQIPAKFKKLISDNGMSADDIAAMHGLASGSDLMSQISTEPTLNAKVKELTQSEMIKRHGDILTDGTIEEEAAQAIRNPEHAKKLMAELNALTRKTKQPAIDREAIKAYAKQTIGAMAYSKIRPAQYRAAEVRAAREAAIAKNKGDFAAAQTAKQQEIINFYLSREATAVKEKAEANRKYLQATQVKKFNPKDVNPDYITQIQAVANLYEFRKNPENQDRARSRLQSIAAWIEAQEAKEQEGFYPVIIDSILSDINSASKNGLLETIDIPSYKEMTGEQIQAIAEQVKNLRYIGGKLSENSKEVLKAEAKKVGDSIRANANGIVAVPEEITKRDKTLSALREFGEDHVRLANQIEELDGYKEFGPLFEGFYQEIIDSTNKELKLKRDTFDDVVSALSGLTSRDVAPGKGEITINYDEVIEGAQPIKHNLTLSRRARIVFGLYWGSPEGREAIRIGHHMTDEQAQLMLDTLDEKDIQAIEGVWKANEKHWPEISRINQKLKGVTLPKVEHVPYSINGRQLAGGYFRLFYQYSQKDSVREIKAEDLLMTRTGNRLSKQTKNGSRNERVGSGGRKVSWEFNNIFLALDETIHDIAFAETASKASRFIRTPEVSSAIIDTYGKEKYDSMSGSLSSIISGNTAMSHPISGFLQHFRVAQTYSMLGYSIRNFVQQPIAFTNVFGKAVTSFEGYGEIKVMKEALNFAMSPKEFMAFVDSKSEFMINRTSIVNRDTADIRNKLSAGSMAGGAWAKFKDHAFDIQTVGDACVAYPAWKSAYIEGLKKFADEKKAVTFADEFVSSTVGSGLIKDLAPLLQGGGKIGQAIGSEQLKGITFMGSFFNITHNLMRESYKRSNKLEVLGVKTIPTELDFYRQTMWYLTVPALLGAWITGSGPDDDESILAWAAKNVAAYGLAAVFIVRDIVSMARGFGTSSSYTRAGNAAIKLFEESVKIAKDEKDVDLKTTAKVIRAAGMLFPLPSAGQTARTFEYLGSDEEFNPYKALVTGVER